MNAHRRLMASSNLLLLGLALSLGLLSCHSAPGTATEPNTLTSPEKRAGWKLLLDGRTMNGWRGAYMDSLPSRGWEVRDGALGMTESGGGEASFGGDLVTIDEYGNFELLVDFKLTEGANSGIKYFVIEAEPKTPGSAKGLEYQLLDDARHPDAKLGVKGNRTCASLYDLIPAVNRPPVPIGAWNHARILVKGTHVEHWLNGVKVLEFERGGPEFLAHKAESKFKDIPGFGEYPAGHILLQDHGNRVFFRNIKIRIL
ncbi:MAG: 3-keto-disaccharide hydrolase [Candidatus Aminicenantales bacterium]